VALRKAMDLKRYWTIKGRTYITDCPPKNNGSLIVDELAKLKFSSILDIGCGYGRHLKLIKESFPNTRLIGADISPTMLESARRYLNDSIELYETDGLHLPFGDKEFDIIFTFGCMIEVPEVKPFYQEIKRVGSRGLFLESYVKGLRMPSRTYFSHDYPELFGSNYSVLYRAVKGNILRKIYEELYLVELTDD